MQESKKLFLFTKKTDTKRQGSVLLGLLLLWAVLFFPIAASAFDKFSPNDTIPPASRRGTEAVELQDTLPGQPVLIETPETDSRKEQADKQAVFITENDSENNISGDKHSQLKATLLSATLPGLGQAYNGDYWKIPIIYGGFGVVAYYVWFNNNEYKTFKRAYQARLNGNPNIIDDFPFYSTDQLQRATNFYRRNLEITYIFGAGIYALNILDASGIVKLPPLRLPSLKHPGEPHSPLKATMLSATLPGLGQAYNGKHWKIPIIYAGFGAVAYAVRFNNTEYQAFRRAYVARVDGNPNTVVDEELDVYSTDQLQRATNFYRRNLEITYILGAALYVLNILDATVDAHLLDFDVGEDLSMKLHPVVFPGVNPTNAAMNSFAGLRFTFRF